MRSCILMAVLVATAAGAQTNQPYPPLLPMDELPYVPPTSEQKRWALATCAILTESNQGRHDLLGGSEHNARNKAAQETLLAEWWGVQNRLGLYETLEWIETGGHRRGFDELAQLLAKASPVQVAMLRISVAGDSERSNSVEVVRTYKDVVGRKSIIAWDFDRYVALCGWGYLAEYLTEEEAWRRIMPVARMLQKTFSSWEDLGQNHVAGREFWSLRQTQRRGELTRQCYKKLLTDPSSPWVKLKWDLDLSPPKSSANKAPPKLTDAPGEVRLGGRPAGNMDLFASGNNGCIIYINGEPVMTVRRERAGKARLGLREGDLITVRLSDRFDINSFWMDYVVTKNDLTPKK